MSDSAIWLAMMQPLLAVMVACLLLTLARCLQEISYLAWHGVAFLCYALGISMQVMRVPSDGNDNVILSGALYAIAVVSFAQGVARIRQRSIWKWGALVMALGWLGRAWFTSVEDDLETRLWIWHLSVTIVLAMGVWAVRFMWQGAWWERLFFWV